MHEACGPGEGDHCSVHLEALGRALAAEIHHGADLEEEVGLDGDQVRSDLDGVVGVVFMAGNESTSTMEALHRQGSARPGFVLSFRIVTILVGKTENTQDEMCGYLRSIESCLMQEREKAGDMVEEEIASSTDLQVGRKPIVLYGQRGTGWRSSRRVRYTG